MIIEVNDSSQTGEARRRAVAQAEQLAFDETQRGAVAIVVTEIATNLVKHAREGKIYLQSLRQNGSSGLRLIAMDKGSGIKDLARALEDGHSTTGTRGTGLGAVRRLSHRFEIYSNAGVGTCILAEFWCGKKAPQSTLPLQVGVVSVPVRGEEANGDGWGVRQFPESILLMVVDGLGHGVLAAEAAREGERVLRETHEDSPGTILQDSHGALRKTRGAAMAVAAVNCAKGVVSFAGIGNIAGSIVSPDGTRGMASHNGTLGQEIRKIQEFTFPWRDNSILIMHSDGISHRWDLSKYPGIWGRDPGLIAAVLFRDFARERDDATVLVAKSR